LTSKSASHASLGWECDPGCTVKKMAFQRDNHYVSCLYLKRFAASPGRVWTYRTLVAHSPHKPPDGPFQTSSHQRRSRLSSSVPSPANIMRLKKCVVIFGRAHQ